MSLRKTPYRTLGPYTSYLVDAPDIRSHSLPDEEFTDYAIHMDFPSLIPENEIWIASTTYPTERPYLFQAAVAEYRAYEKTGSYDKAYHHAVAYERAERRKARGGRNVPPPGTPPREVYESLLLTLPALRVSVYLVRGDKVRDLYNVNFVEGGHDRVYPWIPRQEIWLESAIPPQERAVILLHEMTERTLMEYLHMGYDKAHELSAQVEFAARNEGTLTLDQLLHYHPQDLLALTRKPPLTKPKQDLL